MAFAIKRVYEASQPIDGYRVLIDGLWPRGISKEKAGIHAWLRDVAPSAELRKWFDHIPERWDGFKIRYFAELDQKIDPVLELLELAEKGRVTLLYAAREERFNNAVALAAYLQDRANDGSRPI